ncbi:MAG: phosphoglycerate dehydrogenase [Verrucomicrobiota bacterium]
MANPHTILVADPISEVGIAELQADPNIDVDVITGQSEDELLAIAEKYEGIIVRSQTKITAKVLEAAPNLKAVGRAGVGVDNIDIPAATKHGVVVMNTPTGNTISTAEHAFSLMLSLARHIPQAHASVIAGKWERKQFEGVELHNKTLAILGMGRIGSELARRAMAFGMRVIAYDPYLSASKARLLRIELVEEVDEAVKQADFITLHMPMTPETKHIINEKRIALLKPGVRIINCARGGLIDETALGKGLEAGTVAGAALDVYETEPPPEDYPYYQYDNTVLTPHLGASTQEAQESVGIEIARAVRAHLVEGTVINAVNMPSIDEQTVTQIGPYLKFAETLGKILPHIVPKQADFLRITYSGKVGDLDTSLITRSVLTGYLEKISGDNVVNHINAPSFAENLGLRVTESRLSDSAEFAELIEVTAGNEEESVSVAGTFFGNTPRIVKLRDRYVEAAPEGNLLLVENTDVPGIVGLVGSLLGKHQLNIASMSLSRNQVGDRALTVLNLDSEPDPKVLTELESLDGIHQALAIPLG